MDIIFTQFTEVTQKEQPISAATDIHTLSSGKNSESSFKENSRVKGDPIPTTMVSLASSPGESTPICDSVFPLQNQKTVTSETKQPRSILRKKDSEPKTKHITINIDANQTTELNDESDDELQEYFCDDKDGDIFDQFVEKHGLKITNEQEDTDTKQESRNIFSRPPSPQYSDEECQDYSLDVGPSTSTAEQQKEEELDFDELAREIREYGMMGGLEL